MRVFAAAEITSDAVRDKLAAVSQELGDIGQRVRPRRYHITLKFFGDDLEPAAVREIAQRMEQIDADPCQFTVKGLGAFPHRDYITVLWAGTDNRITPLITSVQEVFDLREEYTPHVTLCRFNSLSPEEKTTVQALLEDRRETVFGEEQVERLVLKKSELTSDGPQYTNIHTVMLQ